MTSTLRTDPNFQPLLAGFGHRALEGHGGTVVGLWADLRMAYLNPAWFTFARENDGEPDISRDWPLGRSIMEAVPEDLHRFYHRAFRDCLAKGVPWHHDYECSSADIWRLLHLTVYPLGHQQGFLMVHSPVQAHPHRESERPTGGFSAPRHLDDHGFVHQCANCRRIQNLKSPTDRWDWLPALVEVPYPQVSHTICPICMGYYHPR